MALNRKTIASAQPSARSIIAAIVVMVALAGHSNQVAAADSASLAAQISDSAFAMLNAINATDDRGKSNPAQGPLAIFAGDAQTLSHSLATGDSAAAASAIAALKLDRDAVDRALASRPGAVDAAQWKSIAQQMDALTNQLAAAAPKADGVAASHAASGTVAAAASASSSVSRASSPPGSSPASTPLEPGKVSAPPTVVIDSRTANGSVIRVKGYLQGTHLTRGGIYQGTREFRDFKVGGILGQQRLDFDVGVGNPPADAVIRVYDSDGRMAEAPINDPATAALASAEPPSTALAAAGTASSAGETPDIPPLPSSTNASPYAPSKEGGVEVFRNSTSDSGAGPGGHPGANTAEIPSHGAPRPSPSKRRALGGQLGNVQINIIAANQVQTLPPAYEVIGQIQGRGITRAGIYIDGRLVKSIPIESGAGYTSFDQRFVINGGAATIRAYGVGDQFVESSIDLGTGLASADSPMMTSPMMPGPMNGGAASVVVQIANVAPIMANLYVVSGVISGRSLAGAGLYQNGMLVQNIPVGAGGIGGIIGSLIGGGYRSVNFSARFNPQAGPATIRAFDAGGAYAEQPVMAGGANPFGMGVNPYGMNPYGAYGPGTYPANPYAGGTFGAPPVNPYMPPTNPFSAPRTSRPLW